MLKKVIIITVVLLIVSVGYVNRHSIGLLLHKPDAAELSDNFMGKTLTECAEYYMDVRGKLDFADKIFADSIVPLLELCDYFDIKKIKEIVAGSPVENSVNSIYDVIREGYLEDIHYNLVEYANAQKELFSDTIIPIMLTELDSVFALDFEKFLDDYNDDWFRSFNPSREDLVNCWNSNIKKERYKFVIDSVLFDYKSSVLEFYTDYYEELGVDKYRINDLPNCNGLVFELPQQASEEYIFSQEEERKKILIDLGVDVGIVVLTISTGGAAAPVVKTVTFLKKSKDLFDIGKAFWDNIGKPVYSVICDEEAEISDEESFMLGCSLVLNVKVSEYLQQQYNQYFDYQTDLIFNQIKENL